MVLLGDSITQLGFGPGGWASALANYYQRRLDVLNRGYAGYNSRWVLELLDDEAFVGARVATVFFGANDASLASVSPRQFVPLEEYVGNLRTIVAKIRRSCDAVVLICPPPVDEAQRLAYQKQRYGDRATGVAERTNDNAGRYASACAALAEDLGVPCVNLWDAMQRDAPSTWPAFLSDGLHLSPAGNQFLATMLTTTIATHFPHLAVTPCPHTGHYGTSGSSSPGLRPDAPWHDGLSGAEAEE